MKARHEQMFMFQLTVNLLNMNVTIKSLHTNDHISATQTKLNLNIEIHVMRCVLLLL